MVKVAICYFGLTRSTRYVYQSHIANLFDVLRKNNVDFDTFMHTWKTKYNIIWETIYKEQIDYDEYKLLKPTHYQIDDQDIFTRAVDSNFHLYYNRQVMEEIGEGYQGEWRPMLIRNHLCALESQRRVFKMVTETGNNYDAVIFIRPDVCLKNEFDVSFVLNLGEKDIVVADYEHGEGFNDKFCIGHPKTFDKYANRIDEIAEFRRTHSRIVSEKYVKFIIQKYDYNVRFINFYFNIVRPDGKYINV
jgi:hypothetical protein